MATIHLLTRIEFGAGAVGLLGESLAQLGVAKPLLVTDPGIRDCGILERVLAALPAAVQPAVFDETPENPTEAAAARGAARYAAEGCDGIVGLGGGSAMDQAKAIALLATNPGPLEQYAVYRAGPFPALRALAKLALVPTTAGTGAEVSRVTVIAFESGRKAAIGCPFGSIGAAIVDPALTLGLPRGLTAATGMDAVSHCVETFCSVRDNPPADAIALDGLERLVRHIERVLADGADLAARSEMMMGAMEGALAFQKGLGAVHALSHQLGALHLHHGTLNAVLLPHVLAYNSGHLGEKRARLARALGLGAGADLPQYFSDLNRRIGMPAGLGAMGVPRARLGELAASALEDGSHPTNPRPMQHADYERVLQAAF
jgi:hypothetical protein